MTQAPLTPTSANDAAARGAPATFAGGLLAFARRRWWLLLAGPAFGLGGAAGYLAYAGPLVERGLPTLSPQTALAAGAGAGLLLGLLAAGIADLMRQRRAERATAEPQNGAGDGAIADFGRSSAGTADAAQLDATSPMVAVEDGLHPNGSTPVARVGRARRDLAPAQRSYVEITRQWWWVLAIGAVLGAGGAVAFTQYGPVPYQSTAQVLVPPMIDLANQNDALGSPTRARAAAANFAAQASSSRTFELVSKALDGLATFSVRELLLMNQNGRIDIRPTREANFINIVVTDGDPDGARLLANTIAAVFVDDVNEGARSQLQTRRQQLEQQIDLTRNQFVTAQLQQRERDLLRDLWNQRSQLLQVQAQYQQELQRQIDLDRLPFIAPGLPPVSLDQQQRLQQLREAQTQVRSQWLKLTGEQQRQVEQNIAEINAELSQVRGMLGSRGSDGDPLVAAAFASAYSLQLQGLTREYARLEMNADTLRAPVVRYGSASEPLPALGLRKALPIGTG
ncbi:MAG: hypothetical protein HY691_09970, partial [Chloroflexi bacterium]|nr:hypothetical protein [Chloroflexota bacterium]